MHITQYGFQVDVDSSKVRAMCQRCGAVSEWADIVSWSAMHPLPDGWKYVRNVEKGSPLWCPSCWASESGQKESDFSTPVPSQPSLPIHQRGGIFSRLVSSIGDSISWRIQASMHNTAMRMRQKGRFFNEETVIERLSRKREAKQRDERIAKQLLKNGEYQYLVEYDAQLATQYKSPFQNEALSRRWQMRMHPKVRNA